MARNRTLSLCVFLALLSVCCCLMLERLPRHVPRFRPTESPEDEDEADNSVERKQMRKDALIMKSSWKVLYPSAGPNQHPPLFTVNKRSTLPKTTQATVRDTLAQILRDDEQDGTEEEETKKALKKKKNVKSKRQAATSEPEKEEDELQPKDEKFQEWLRHEYYRNIAKSFASMRRKRDESSVRRHRAKKSVVSSRTPTSLADITENLRTMEDQLFADALQVLRDPNDVDEDEEDESRRQTRVSNDLNLAYDLERMRSAFLGLQETLKHMQDEEQDQYRYTSKKRSGVSECEALESLTSDCSALSDVMPEGSLKNLLQRACNWHEVCYTCGKSFGLNSEQCDGSFIEQTQTICRDDAPCESTASLLMVPLRQRRVFYKRSNPDVCLRDPCVEEFLREGIEAMQEEP